MSSSPHERSAESEQKANKQQFARWFSTYCALVVGIFFFNDGFAGTPLNNAPMAVIVGAVVGAIGYLIGRFIAALLSGWTAWLVSGGLAICGLVGAYAFHVARPMTVAEAQQQALKQYPQLGVLNSPLNREFVARYRRYRVVNSEFFRRPDWPLQLAAECQAEVGGATK